MEDSNRKFVKDHKEELDRILEKESFKDKETNEKVTNIVNNLMNLEVTAEVVNASKISKTLKGLLEKGEEEVKKLVKKLIIKWKGIFKNDNKSTEKIIRDNNNINNISSCQISTCCDTSITLELKEDANLKNLFNKLNPESKDLGKTLRTKIEKEGKDVSRRNTKLLIYDSLLKAKDDAELIYAVTLDIEEGLYKYFIISQNNQKTKYLKQVKNIVMNLGHNMDFVQDILSGKLTGDQLAPMNPLDFASEASKQRRQKLLEDAFNSRRSDWNRLKNPGTPGLYKCGKCKSYMTTYYQAQIRRADEPMTTFVSCLECTHSWKF